MSNYVFTVGELSQYIKELLESDAILQHVWLKGEISNYKKHSSGHMYLTLKDANSCLNAVMFRGKNIRLRFVPENGMKVIVYGSMGLYEKTGQYQLYIQDMIPDGLGALHVAFEQLKTKLQAEGLFDADKKRGLPAFPRRIGIITSPTGAAIHDILTVIERRFCGVEIVLYPVRVQGREAPAEIARAIQEMNDLGNIDVMIVGRGGGSIEELWAFNEELVARSIFASQIPVVSAVGHETDFTIADFVSDMRAPTPSAAAEMIVPEKEALLQYLVQYQNNLTGKMKMKLEMMAKEIQYYKGQLQQLGPVQQIQTQNMHLEKLLYTINGQILDRIEQKRLRIKFLKEKLEALNPDAVLSRGYSICRRLEQEEIITDEKQLKQDEKLEIIFCRGRKIVRVEE